MRQNHLFFYLFLLASTLAAQNPATDQAWLNTGNISLRITPTGIHADSLGGFLLNRPGVAPVNLLSHLTPWICGLDPAGNLRAACEMDDQFVSDWKPGIRGIDNSAKMWKVTKEQITAHLADYEDNGVIDDPIAEIFSWPGTENPFSQLFNGFDIESSYFLSAQYYDRNENGRYDPQDGDYPRPRTALQDYQVIAPDELIYSAFFNDTIGALSHGKSVHTDASLHAFAFNCNGNEFLENAAFLSYRFQYTGDVRLDSTFFGIYSDFDIGDARDDYLGCTLPSSHSVYAYNANPIYDEIAGLNPPMLGMNLFAGPLDTNGIGLPPGKVMPILDSGIYSTGAGVPKNLNEFYNYNTGSWRDGSPLTYGGTGYGGDIKADFAYPAHPANPNAWSEVSADNMPGNRKAITSFGPLTLFPGAGNEITLALTASTAAGPSAQLAELKSFKKLQDVLVYGVWFDLPPDTLKNLCFPVVKTKEPKVAESLSFFPNPASSSITILNAASAIRELAMFDLVGKKVLAKKFSPGNNQEVILDTNTLPAGIYTLQWLLEDGRRGTGKVVIAR